MKYLFVLLAFFLLENLVLAQDAKTTTLEKQISKLKYRFVGPFRGGRSTAVTGIADKPHVFYMGSTGGGVWKTDDAGNTWNNLSDGQIKCGSIGSVAVAPSSDQTIYVGTGSACPRGNVSMGIGAYKSEDGGENWNHIGLDDAGQIGKIRVHPENPDVAYAAALGNPFKPNATRGVFKTIDGGQNWDKVLFLDDSTGCSSLEMHPESPNILYAGLWRSERKPWTLIDGSASGGVYKTRDGGESWEKLKNGLPEGVVGKIDIAISPANPQRIWILMMSIDEEKSGLYRSDDGGKSFKKINRDRKLRQRAWYYIHLFADPADENTVYICNVNFYKSIDGGKSFSHRYRVPHGDTHDLWVNPENSRIMINANDGGACVTLNGGKTWSDQYNQPTAEFYRLTVDNQWPYRLYAGQQDNSTISLSSRNPGGIHPKSGWYAVGGGESADVAVHPENPDIVYATTYSGIITRIDRKTGEERDIGAYPHYTEGTEMRDLKYRWQWNFPIRVSIHDPNILYMTSNYVHRSSNEGQSWDLISPDLTRAIDAYFDIPGGPIQHDATGVEVYGTIFAFEESPLDPQTLWAGTDDGRIQITRDGGTSWTDITPENLIPQEATINNIRISPHSAGEAYVAAYHYRYGDFKPYILQTQNHGQSWKLLTSGSNSIPDDHFVRCVEVDPENPNLLFAGTEYGMYFSFDKGKQWQSLQSNLPHTPVTDFHIVGNELALSTQGRGFWIFDQLDLLRQLVTSDTEIVVLFKTQDTYRSNVGGGFRAGGAPDPAPYRAHISFNIPAPDTSKEFSLEILDGSNFTIRKYTREGKDEDVKIKIDTGLNKVRWNLRYPAPKLVKDLVMMDMRHPGQGQKAPPGKYTVRMKYGDDVFEESFSILKDPRWQVTDEDLIANFKLAAEVKSLLSVSQNQLKEIRSARKQIKALIERSENAGFSKEIKNQGKALVKTLDSLELMIYQNQIEESQDEINYPRKFTNHLVRLYRVVISQDARPSSGELERWEDLKQAYMPFEKSYRIMFNSTIPEFLDLLKKHEVPLIILPDSKK